MRKIAEGTYWVIEFNECGRSVPSFEGQYLSKSVLSEIRMYDLTTQNEDGYYKFFFEKYENGQCVKRVRMDIGDGWTANKPIYDFLEAEIETTQAQSKLNSMLEYWEGTKKELAEYLIQRYELEDFQYFPMDEFNSFAANYTPWEISKMVTFGDYNPNHDYFRITEDLKVISMNWATYERFLENSLLDIVNEISEKATL